MRRSRDFGANGITLRITYEQNLAGLYGVAVAHAQAGSASTRLVVHDGSAVATGDVLACTPHRTLDISTGLPQLVQLLEMRKPRQRAFLADTSGIAKFRSIRRRRLPVEITDSDYERVQEVPIGIGTRLLIDEGDRVKAGDPLTVGDPWPPDVLDVLGERAAAEHLLREMQSMFVWWRVPLHDKHLELLLRQLFSWIEIVDSRESQFPVGLLMPRHAFRREMKRLFERGGSQPLGKIALLGISKVVRLVYSVSGIKSLD